jgi:hypothetical protein
LPPIPIVSPVSVARPVAAQAYEDESAVIVRPEKPERAVGPVAVADGTAAIRPGYPREYRAGWVIMAMVVINASVSVWVISVAVVLSGNPVRAKNWPITGW